MSALIIGVSQGALLGQACTSENPGPSDGDDVIPSEGSGGNSSTGGAENLGGASPDTGGTGGGLVSEPTREDCPEDPNGESGDCWDLSDCNGAAPEQFLNQCVGGDTCIGAFDNETRIEGFEGTLPPL